MWDNPRQLDTIALVIALAATIALLWTATNWALRQPVFEFRRVVVSGTLSRANPAHLEAVVREELRGTFFTMNLGDARASLQRVPWIRGVALRRQWPNRLEIVVSEQEPFARWNEAALVNVQGEVFTADYDGELPQFLGPEGSSGEMTARYREFGAALKPLGMTVVEVRLSPRGGWQLKTEAAAMTLNLGRTEPDARLARFVAFSSRTVGALARNGMRTEYVDLRYRNGFAARVPAFKERAPKKAA